MYVTINKSVCEHFVCAQGRPVTPWHFHSNIHRIHLFTMPKPNNTDLWIENGHICLQMMEMLILSQAVR